ncbi:MULTISPECIES: MFS transporter [Kitasatospora]|uniref:Putative major facilitator superfamily transporter n=1 Tax=Kitasatospora setae (strain ATCC 33774 / DSM 43861 / JCM 3304 / KCC A-0304 / NBRC 14216 / KM-6054) TaxID=452652 RepID=E4NJW5_KITSK|nr:MULTISPECIES: MFS transporter [Kitasatospora]BAJ33263.1 putative major facilitator superfamily transporter [Kitasatospora setae KM-6054]
MTTARTPAAPPSPAVPSPTPAAPPSPAVPPPRPTFRLLVRSGGGPRYAAALLVDALGSGLLRPFLLLYGIEVLRLDAAAAGLAMTGGIVAGLACMPPLGRWLDRGARSSAVAAAMLVRVLGVAALLAAPTGGVALFTLAALFLGIGNQAWPAAHAALVTTVAAPGLRDTALAAARAVRNAGLGLGALLATVCLTGGAPALRALAALSGAGFLAAAALARSVRVHAAGRDAPGTGPAAGAADGGGARRLWAVLLANTVYVFCLNVPEIAVPLVLVAALHASPAWPAAVFVANTVLVVTLQVPVTAWAAARWPRARVLTVAGAVLAASYLGILAATPLGPLAVALLTVPCTLGEILYAGSATPLVTALAPPGALGRALSRLQFSTGLGLALSPAVMTALAPAVLWPALAAGTLAAAGAVHRVAGGPVPAGGLAGGPAAG